MRIPTATVAERDAHRLHIGLQGVSTPESQIYHSHMDQRRIRLADESSHFCHLIT